MALGTIPPTTIETANQRPSAVAGSNQPLLRMLTNKSTAPNSEIKISN